MNERRIDLTESQLRKLVKSVRDEAFSDGERRGIGEAHYSYGDPDREQAWANSFSIDVLDNLIALEQEHAE